MPQIQTVFTLIDRMTAPLRNIGASLDNTKAKAHETGGAVDDMGDGASKAESSFKRLAIAGAALAGSVQTLKQFVNISDMLASTEARLNNIVDSTMTLNELSEGIFQSAQRSRAEYETTAQFVSRVGSMAGGLFSGNQELIRFAETLNKQMVLSGTSTMEAQYAMVQLSQALGSGVLRGEELNSVFEQAPAIIKMIADYLDVDIGQIRSMAAEGQLTAEIVKNAVLAGTAEVDAKFDAMPKTWAQTWQGFIEQIQWGLRPLAQVFSEIVNSAAVQQSLNMIAQSFAFIARGAAAAINAMRQCEALQPVFKFLGILIGGFLVAGFIKLGLVGVMAFGKLAISALMAAGSFALAHLPLTVMIGIFALVVTAATEMGYSLRDIFGGVAGVVAGVGYTVITVFKNAFSAAKAIVHNVMEGIKSLIINGIGKISNKINDSKFLAKLGIHADAMSYEASYMPVETEMNLADAFAKGRGYGVLYANKAFNWIEDKGQKLQGLADQANTLADFSNVPDGKSLLGQQMDDLNDSVKDGNASNKQTADNTKKMAEALKNAGLSIAQLKASMIAAKMHNIERDVKINISAPITANGNTDLDGFVTELVDKIEDQLANNKRGPQPVGVG